MSVNKIQEIFNSLYDKSPTLLIQAPGRINIMGEHTDYNFGYVLPAAINYYLYLGFSKNNTEKFNIYSADYDQQITIRKEELKPGKDSWVNLIKGVIHQLKEQISGFDLVISGDIPVGAGLSSSAALCCGTGMGITHLYNLDLEKWDIAKIAQKSEHDFAHVKCGIMDQFASLFGIENHILMLDCLSFQYSTSAINMQGFQFVLLNSNVSHELSESDYNSRNIESLKALDLLRSQYDTIETYRDVSMAHLTKLKPGSIYWKRAQHILSENQRVLSMKKYLEQQDFKNAGRLLSEGHHSEQKYFEITCDETDFLVSELSQYESVMGSRQVGGGFGGCVLAIVKDQNIESMLGEIDKKYQVEFNNRTTYIPIKIAQGCSVLRL